MTYDYLIIGQGLAGSIIGYKLAKRNKKVIIFDEGKETNSSMVAAGLANPFTGPRMVKSWKAEQLFPVLKRFYTKLEQELGVPFLRERIIYRPFSSVEELNDWEGRSAHPNYQMFIRRICQKNVHQKYIYDPFGGIEIAGYTLDVRRFVGAVKHFFQQYCTYVEAYFDEAKLERSDEGYQYGSIRSTNVIYCSGYHAHRSENFHWLPMAPVKGEILIVKPSVEFETIYNKSCFIIPQNNRYCKAGSTYVRDDLSETPTEEGRNKITKKLGALLKMDYEVVGHEAGIRPGTIPRRPLIGRHPVHAGMSIFNGLGTKGVSLGPLFGEQLVNCLEEGNYLDSEVDIKRYYSLYFNSQKL